MPSSGDGTPRAPISLALGIGAAFFWRQDLALTAHFALQDRQTSKNLSDKRSSKRTP
jgi:hypothetical protein